jgi:hypothetical protein
VASSERLAPSGSVSLTGETLIDLSTAAVTVTVVLPENPP